ncbi:hypothetical protein Lalb_Chr05g0212101 [Lupinus albus]|uniref:Uncharacterized protein n=1 Tax=Lupinus albus TaxID=3870 RepID=A0A6A4QGY5_LUPAL|nr:hypothetical protein Lalb_Chr05g0212101 [Lupinus albus]
MNGVLGPTIRDQPFCYFKFINKVFSICTIEIEPLTLSLRNSHTYQMRVLGLTGIVFCRTILMVANELLYDV